MGRRPVRALLAALLTAALSAGVLSHPAWAHGPDQILQETYVFVVDGDKVAIEYHSSYGALLARVKLTAADTDGDGCLSAAEKTALLEKAAAAVRADLRVSIDGATVEMRYSEGRIIAPPLRRLAGTATLAFRFDGDVPDGTGPQDDSPHVLRVEDRNFPGPMLGHMTFYVSPGPTTRRLDVSRDARVLEWAFVLSPTLAANAAHAGTAGFYAARRAADDRGDEEGTLTGFILCDEPTVGFYVVALLMAAGLGVVHALSPGHGKAMVAAYLVGSKGRIRDAVLLGGVVTFTHVISVVILGVASLALTEYVAPEELYPWLGFASGCLVFVIGYWLVASRALGLGSVHSHTHPHGHPHAHPHSHADSTGGHSEAHGDHHGHDHGEAVSHAHGHGHEHADLPAGRGRTARLLSLGISGGMVPCPSALVVLLAAIAVHRIAFGLALILAFSVGLAAVLILIGVLAVTATRFVAKSTMEGRWVRALPVVSAGVIMLVGISLAFTSLLSGGVLKAGL